MRAAAAQVAFQRVADFGVGRIRICIEQRFRRHQDAAGAIAALRGLFVDECTLQRMQRGIRAQRLHRGDLLANHGRHRHVTRLHSLAVDDHGACAALAQAAAVTRADQAEVIAQGVE